MLVSKKPHGPNASHCRPKANRWNVVRIEYARFGYELGMLILYCLSRFCLRLVPNANTVSGEIWALDFQRSVVMALDP